MNTAKTQIPLDQRLAEWIRRSHDRDEIPYLDWKRVGGVTRTEQHALLDHFAETYGFRIKKHLFHFFFLSETQELGKQKPIAVPDTQTALSV